MTKINQFRGVTKETSEWVYGDLLYDFDNQVTIIKAVHYNCGDGVSEPPHNYRLDHEVIEHTVGQFIDNGNKFGKCEIYEGDIVKHLVTGREGTITYNIDKCGFYVKCKNSDNWELITEEWLNVIDNIYGINK